MQLFEINIEKLFSWYGDLVKSNEVLAHIITFLFFVFILYILYNQIKDLIDDFVNHRGRKRFLFSSLIIVLFGGVLSVGLIKGIKYSDIAAPVLKVPDDIVSGRDIIEWEHETKDASSYIVQASLDKDFTNVLINSKLYDTTYPISGDVNKTLFWRVGAITGNNIDNSKNADSVEIWSDPKKVEHYKTILSRIKQSGELKVAMVKDYGDSAFRFFYGIKRQGIDPAIACEISKKLSQKLGKKITVKFSHMEWEDILSSIGKGQYDFAISTITNFQEREGKYGIKFSDPYHTTGYSLVYKRGHNISSSIYSNIFSKNVGILKNTSSAKCAKRLNSQNGGNATIREYSNFNRLMTEIQRKNGELDFAVTDTPHSRFLTYIPEQDIRLRPFTKKDFNSGSDENCWKQSYSIAIREDGSTLLSLINTYISEMRKSGKLEDIKRVSNERYSETFRYAADNLPKKNETGDYEILCTKSADTFVKANLKSDYP